LTHTLTYKFIAVCILLTCTFNSIAQNAKTDSLLILLKKDKENALKARHLNELSYEFRRSNPDSSLMFAISANMLAKKLNLKKELSTSYGNLGVCFRIKSEYDKALGYFKQALEIDRNIHNRTGEALHLGNIGVVYKEQAEYSTALGYYFKAAKIYDEIDDKPGKATNFSNIGNVYSNLREYKKALNYYLKALKIDKTINDKSGMAKHYGNIGNIFYSQLNYDEALRYNLKALKLATEVGDKNGIAADLGNIGNVYYDQGDYKRSLAYYLNALKANELVGDKNGIAINCGNIGSLYTKVPSLPSPAGETEKGYVLAAKYLYRAIAIDDSIGTKYGLQYRYESLANLYEVSSDPLPDSVGGKLLNPEEMRIRALYYFKMFENIKDGIYSEEQKKQLIRKELNFEFEKKAALAESEKKTQQIFLILVSASALLILIIAVFILRSLRNTRKQKNIIEKSNKEKELLLKEIHHRVKNNLQVISSLLRLQSNNISDAATLAVVRQAQVRVRSMGLIHQKLYQAGNFSAIDFSEYLEQLTSYVSEMYHDGLGEITCEIKTEQKHFNIDTATPLGLIVTELLSNSYKYAFKKGESGKIVISITHVDKNHFLLLYSDSGKGIPEGTQFENSTTLGLELIRLLTEQLSGTVKTYNKNGAVFEIHFISEITNINSKL
jgi:two-component system, sensor histidine kinase PdtaS